MDQLSSFIKERPVFFYGFILFMMAGVYFLLSTGNHESFFILNGRHLDWLDSFMEYYTNVGNGFFAILLGAAFFFLGKQRALGLAILYAFLSSGLLVQIVKHLHDSPRPQLALGAYNQSYFIRGIEFAHNNSFPSGHTATAFATATVCVWMLSNKQWQLPVLIAAILVGYSRIYTGQHFLLDVMVGAPIGVLCGIIFVMLARKYNGSKAFGSFK